MNYFQDLNYVRKLYSQKEQVPFRGESVDTAKLGPEYDDEYIINALKNDRKLRDVLIRTGTPVFL